MISNIAIQKIKNSAAATIEQTSNIFTSSETCIMVLAIILMFISTMVKGNYKNN
jgi:hypothetical protein